jgi:general secretion pathway protein F
MPVYAYVAVDPGGRKVRARREADDERALRSFLKEQGLTPIEISAAREVEFLPLRRVSRKDLMLFTQELANLLESGMPVDRALFVLAEHTEKSALRDVIRDIYAEIRRGRSLSQALGGHALFPPLYVNMVRAGEVGGILEGVLKRLAQFLETTQSLRDEIVSALIYPLLLTSVGGVSVVVLLFYVIPKFAAVFADMGQQLPGSTLFLMNLSGVLVGYWWMIAGGLAALVLVVRAYARTAEGRLFIDEQKMRLPVVSDLHMKLVIARFARTLGTLLQSGVPVLAAIGVSRGVVGNEAAAERLKDLEDGVRKGRGIAGPLRECGVFPGIVAQVIAVGEEAGNLDAAFMLVAERFEAESKRTIKSLVSLIEPALIIVMGVVVGFIVVSMLLAVFSINEIPF